MRSRVFKILVAVLLLGAAGRSSAAVTTATLSFGPEDVSLKTERSFSELEVEGCVHLAEVGTPDLPVRLLRFAIPRDARVDDVRVTCGRVDALPGSHRVLPAQPRVATGMRAEWADGSEDIYASDSPYPVSRVEYLGDGYLAGHRIATVAVHPLQYVPATGALLLARDISVELALVPAADRSVPRNRVAPWSDEASGRLVASLVTNPEDLGLPRRVTAVDAGEHTSFAPRYSPSLEGSPVEYVIITSENFEPLFTDYAEWKTRLGVPTVVRTLQWIESNYPGGVDTPERIRQFIQDAYTSWGTTYVLLGGDTGIVPARYAKSRYQGGELIPADIYYSTLEGNWNWDGDQFFGEGYGGVTTPGDSVDLYPDVFVGRAPVADIVELETFISKNETYVLNPDACFTDRDLVLAEVLFPYDWEDGPISYDGAADVIEPIVNLFPADVHLTRLYANNDPYPESYELNAPASLDSLDAGYNIAFHVGHGNKDVLRVNKNNYITMSDVSMLSNSLARSSFIWLLDCTTAAIDYDCIGERALNNPDGGAVGAFGATRIEFPATSKDYLWEWVDLLYTHDVVNMGETCALAKAAFASPDISGGENSQRWTQMTLVLLGDPELPLWTARAKTLSASHVPTVPVGDSELSVTVTDGAPVADALVTVFKEGDVYESALTEPDGVATLSIDPDTEGSLSVAVTARNHIPSETNIDVTPASGPHLSAGQIAVDDDGTGESNGNGNGKAEAGELVELGIEVRNGGSARADSVTAAITTEDPWVTISDSTADVGSVQELDSTSIASAFTFASADSCPAEHDVLFSVEFSDAARHVWTDEFTVRVHRPELALYLLDIDDSAGNGDGIPEAGESIALTVEIANDGNGAADDVDGTLTAPYGGTTVIHGSEHWGDIPAGQSRVGSLGFEIIVGPDLEEQLSLELVDHYGRSWNCPLELVPPSVPVGLSGKVKSTTIELSWTPVQDADLKGYTVHRSLSPDGPFERVNYGIIETGSYYADSGLAENTLYYFCVAAVDLSGNRSAPSETLSISTNPPAQCGWPLGTGGGMYASPAVADLDGDGAPEIVVASEHVYAWHATGAESIDGDGDPRTCGVFEVDGQGGYRCSPAIGEIDGDPGVELVAAAWADVSGDGDAGIYEVYAWNAEDGSVLPGWPVRTKRFCWASPALADLDRDGLSEVVIACADGNLYCWKHDGSEFIDGDGNAATNGVFADLGGTWVYGSTAVADLDGDHVLELIQPATNDSVYAFHADGSRVDGWPVDVLSRSMCSPAVGDVDGDGIPEVVVGSGAGKFWLLRADGSTMPGWPKGVVTSGDFPPSPVLADVTGNGDLEVVIAGKTGTLAVYDYEGDALPGWPINLGVDTYSSPVVADLDDDPDMEIAVGSQSGKIFAFDADGELIAGWPILTDAEVIGTPAVCDLDGDGDNEVIVGGMDTNVYVWDTAGSNSSGDGVEWGTFLHDSWRSQFHDFVLPTGVDDDADEFVLRRCALEQNSPNPFNPVTTIGFTVPGDQGSRAGVSLSIYSVDGSLVRTLVDGPTERGRHTVVWDGRDRSGNRVASGVYFYRLEYDGGADSKTMVLMK